MNLSLVGGILLKKIFIVHFIELCNANFGNDDFDISSWLQIRKMILSTYLNSKKPQSLIQIIFR